MEIRFKKKGTVFDVLVCLLAALFSVGIMLYGIIHFGLRVAWPELVLNLFYIACLIMVVMYFFKIRITTQQFNYWCSLCLGVTVLLRDILFPPSIPVYPIRLACLVLSVALMLMLTYFYARKEWKTYSRRNLWMICIVDMAIAILYNVVIFMEPEDEFSTYMLTEIWIRPTITYTLVACFVKATEE